MMKPVVVTAIQGGLGNQLFQYFAAAHCAKGRLETIYLNIAYFRSQNKRGYRLGEFAIPQRFATPAQWLLMRLSNACRSRRMWTTIFPEWEFHLVREEDAKGVSNLPSPWVWLEGYWQNYRYLEGLEEVIDQALRLHHPLERAAEEWRMRISSQNSICVHVRRGDYVTEPVTNKVHGACAPAYFREAMERMAGEFPDGHFYVFSDDPSWAAEHVATFSRSTLVEYESPRRDVEDFELMRACRHFVISNSTFSWWPAWLGRAAGKRVIAPRDWFADGRVCDLLPPDWVQL